MAKKNAWWYALAALCAVVIVALIIAAVLRYVEISRESPHHAAGRHYLEFRVFYFENDFFDENPLPPHLDYLMSFTDFIEVDSAFLVRLNEAAHLEYTRVAEQRFIIRPVGSDYIVYEEVIPLMETSGELVTSEHWLLRETHLIFPSDFIAKHRQFVDEHAAQMAAEGIAARGHRGFTAELTVNFAYTMQSPEIGLHETVVHGLRIPLTGEEYSITQTGAANFEWASGAPRNRVSPGEAILFVAIFAANLFGLLRVADRLRPGKNEVSRILRKYSQDIIICDKPVDFKKRSNVPEFGELLKLAINLSRHIRFFQDDTRAEFAVIVGSEAYLYTIEQPTAQKS